MDVERKVWVMGDVRVVGGSEGGREIRACVVWKHTCTRAGNGNVVSASVR